MVEYIGDWAEDDTVYMVFNTFTSNDPQASSTITNFINTDVHIHKDNGLTQRNNAAGITVSVDFDGITGSHMIAIDTNDNTVAGFWVAGSEYFVRIEGTTVDAGTVNAFVGHFSIERAGSVLSYLKAGSTVAASVTGAVGSVTGAVGSVTGSVGSVTGAVGSVTGSVGSVTGHTNQTGDNYARIGVAGAGLTNINLPNQTMDITGNVSGSVGSVSGAVGSVTGAVGSVSGNVDGSTASVVGAVGSVTGAVGSVTGHTNQTGDNYALIGTPTDTDVSTDLVNLQASIDGIGTAGGASINIDAETSNEGGGITGVTSGTTIVGTPTNTYTATSILDGTNHTITHAANAIDIVYQFLTLGGTEPVAVVWTGYLTSANDACNIRAWDHVGGAWEIIGTIAGTGGTVNQVFNPILYTRHRGTSTAELGKIYIRIDCTGQSSPVLNTDQIYVQYSNTGKSTGYALGRVWIDTVGGTAGTQLHYNGTADKPSLTFADAITIAGNLNVHEYNISPDSTLTLAADLNDSNVYGVGYVLELAGFDIAGTHFFHSGNISGTFTAQNNARHADFVDSIIFNVTGDDGHFSNCSFGGTLTFSATQAGDMKLINCHSIIAGATTPIVDFNTGAGINHNFTASRWANGIEFRNFNNSGTDLLSITGTGKIIYAASCSGTVNQRGSFNVTNTGGVTITADDNTSSIILIEADTNELQTDDLPGLIGALNDPSAGTILTTQMTESYAADGVAPTLAQAIYLIQQTIGDFAIAGTTITARQLDGTTTAATYTIDDSANPTSRTRTT